MDSELASKIGDVYANIRGGLSGGRVDLIEEDHRIKLVWRFYGTRGGVSAQYALECFVSFKVLRVMHFVAVIPFCRDIVQGLTAKAKPVSDKH